MRVNGLATGNENGHEVRNAARMCVLCVALVTVLATPLMAGDWTMFGYDPTNTASNGSSINAQNVASLKPRFVFTTGGDISARAAVVGGKAFFPDWAGNLWAINSNNGMLIWSHQLSDYGLPAGTVSRTSPAVDHGIVYIGTQFNPSYPTALSGWLLAIDANKGTLLWKAQPDTSNAFPVLTASPVVAGGVVYVGLTSNEEYVAGYDPAYPCCSVVGSVVALKSNDGTKMWQTFMAPAGYSGANVWGSTPVVDTARGTVFVGTGNNYHDPTDPAYTSCIAGGGTRATCQSPNNHADSIVALDMKTGAVKWATRLETWGQFGVTDGSDFWNTACFIPPFTNCPPMPGPDYDFGSGPNEITYKPAHGGPPVTIIGAGQKSGIYYAINPDTGAEIWHTQVGPGSSLGGMEWGSASDGQRIYVAIANLFGIPYAAGSAGSWAALDPATGNILWQKADPNGAVDLGPLAVANGVVYVPSMGGPTFGGGSPDTAPTMFALDAATGNTLWSFVSGSSVIAGATVVNNNMWWGSGYAHLGIPGFTGNNKFYGFTPNGN